MSQFITLCSLALAAEVAETGDNTRRHFVIKAVTAAVISWKLQQHLISCQAQFFRPQPLQQGILSVFFFFFSSLLPFCRSLSLAASSFRRGLLYVRQPNAFHDIDRTLPQHADFRLLFVKYKGHSVLT